MKLESLLIPVWVKLLTYIYNGDKYPAQMARRHGEQYSTVHMNIAYMEKIGLLTKERYGRITELKLTDKGKKAANSCCILMGVIKDEKGLNRKDRRYDE